MHIGEVCRHHAKQQAIAGKERRALNRAKASGACIVQECGKVGVLFHIAHHHRFSEPERTATGAVVVLAHPPEGRKKPRRQATLCNDGQRIADRQLDVAVFRTEQGNRVVEDGVGGLLEGARRIQTLTQW